MAERLRRDHPDEVEGLADEELLARVRWGLARAESWGLADEASVAAFLLLLFVLGPSFDEYPPIRCRLLRRSVPPGRRMGLLKELTATQWLAARRRYDPAAWHHPEEGPR